MLLSISLQWINIDDLFEDERRIRTALANRAGVLGLVLHQTADHDPMHPITPRLSQDDNNDNVCVTG